MDDKNAETKDDSKVVELLSKLLMDKDIVSDVIEISGIKFRLKLVVGEPEAMCYNGVKSIESLGELMLVNSRKIALAIVEIDGEVFETLLEKTFDDYQPSKDFEHEYKYRKMFVERVKPEIIAQLYIKYIAFQKEANYSGAANKENVENF